MALQALSLRTAAYYWGITWLENHIAPNIDYTARRILALSSHGDNLTSDLALLQAAQMLTFPGNSGWGLTKDYQGTPLDSAMALLAASQIGVTSNVQPALNYLKGAQFTGTDKGWAIAQETVSDPMTTALVVSALVNYKTLDSSLATPIANGVSTLTASVNSSSPLPVQALAALAYLRAGYAGNATPLLSSIAGAQSADGSWSSDPYATALAARAFAASMGTCLSNSVYVPDAALRAAVNAELGKNSMDALTQCDMAELTILNAPNMGISDLTGLEYAVNLNSADLSYNNITSTTPLKGLPNHPVVKLTGNPGYEPPTGGGYTVSAPALSLPGLLFTVIALIAVAVFTSRRKRRFPMSKTTNKILIMLMALLLSLQTASAADKNIRAGKGLTADELQQIQVIGQTVLTANKNAESDPDLQTLKQQVAALQQAITELADPTLTIGNVLSTDSGTPFDQEVQLKQDKQHERENKARNVLSAARSQRSLVQAASGDETGLASIKQAAAAKMEELENAVEEALNSQSDEKAEKLRALKERLTVKYRSQIAAPDTVEKTPTISTVTRHREQGPQGE